MNEGDKTYLFCKCGCDRFWISVTDKNPKKGICCGCREVVSLSTANTLVISRMSSDETTAELGKERKP